MGEGGVGGPEEALDGFLRRHHYDKEMNRRRVNEVLYGGEGGIRSRDQRSCDRSYIGGQPPRILTTRGKDTGGVYPPAMVSIQR
jgi:hypothetical protein